MRYLQIEGKCRLWLDDFPPEHGLAFCGNSVSHVLIPDPEFLASDGYCYFAMEHVRSEISPWTMRKQTIFWRGSSTGLRPFADPPTWSNIPRFQLCLIVREFDRDDLFDVGISGITQVADPTELAEIEARHIVRPPVEILGFSKYRYAIDIDGNSSSWSGLFSKLAMGNTVLKVDSPLGFRQWYYDRLKPWENFIPVTTRMSELLELAEWLVAHPKEAEAIAMNGQALARHLSLQQVLEESAPIIRDHVMRSSPL
jgi:hypothetical protein